MLLRMVLRLLQRNSNCFTTISESNSQTFRTRVEVSLKIAVLKSAIVPKAPLKYQSKTERSLLLGDLGSIIQRYLLAASNRGVVLTRANVVSAANALLKKYENVAGNVHLKSSS